MASDMVPVVAAPNADRILKLRHFFGEHFSTPPDFYVRVPGRVNIIGEHVDYCGYPVLPMALEQDVIIAAKATNDPVLRLVNLNRSYPDYEGHITALCREEGSKPEWYEYIQCGIIGASDVVFENIKPKGIMMAVSGKIPPAAGLSSSSALVCAAALAIFHSNRMTLTKMDLATLCARSEHLIGTAGGGMDQAIAFLAKEGSAQYISWNPLSAVSVMLPSDAVFVVAHSLVEANKAATQDFNDRVRECGIAAQMVVRSLGFTDEAKSKNLTLSKAQKILNSDLNRMRDIVSKLPQKVGRLKIRDRAVHVIEEAIRVEKFKSICENLDGDWEKKLGGLMSASHKSLSKLYECSHPGLDEIVKLSEDFGVHARLTGAGWGGCVVALCTASKAHAYVEMLKSSYYSKMPELAGRDISDLVFITSPKQGAMIYSNL